MNTLTNSTTISVTASASAATSSANPTPFSDSGGSAAPVSGGIGFNGEVPAAKPKSKPIGYCSFRSLKCRDIPAFLLFVAFWVMICCYGWGRINRQYCDPGSVDSNVGSTIDPNTPILGSEHDADFCYWKQTAEQYALYVALLIYIVSIFEAMTCPLSHSLKRTYNAERCYDEYLKAVGTVKPYLKWKSVSWHYVDMATAASINDGSYRKKKSLEAQSRGWGSAKKEKKLKNNEIKKKKVITHVAEHYYDYDECIDISDAFSYAGEAFVHIRTTSAHMFYDEYSRNNFIAQRKAFYTENKKDVFQDKIETTWYSHLSPVRKTGADAGSKGKSKKQRKNTKNKNKSMRSKILHGMMLYGQTDSTQYILRYTYYLYSVLLLCSFWYRWVISSISSDVKLNMRKCLRKSDAGDGKDGAVTVTVTVSGAGKENAAIAASAASVGASASATISSARSSSTASASTKINAPAASASASAPAPASAASSALEVFNYAIYRAPQVQFINGRQVTVKAAQDLQVNENSDSEEEGGDDK